MEVSRGNVQSIPKRARSQLVGGCAIQAWFGPALTRVHRNFLVRTVCGDERQRNETDVEVARRCRVLPPEPHTRTPSA
jgi:hypothetical protein